LPRVRRPSGTSTEDIALGIQAATVSSHIQHILEKIGFHTRIQTVYVSRRCGLF